MAPRNHHGYAAQWQGCKVLALSSVVLLLAGCLSPRYFSNKAIDVTQNPDWWGQLKTNRVVTLKEDSLMNDDALCGGYVHKSLGKYQDEIIKIESYKATPDQWPELSLVEHGARLRCVKLERFFSFENSEYRVYGEFLDGEFKGKVVALFGVMGDPDRKGSLRLNDLFFQLVE